MARVLASFALALISLAASYGIVTFWPDVSPSQQIASRIVR